VSGMQIEVCEPIAIGSRLHPRPQSAVNWNPSSAALATNTDALQVNLDSSLFPGIDSSIEVHNGFAKEQAKYGFPLLGLQHVHCSDDDF
jgi:hypothetical protein